MNEENEKNNQQEEKNIMPIDDDDLKEATGGKSSLADVPRVPNRDYDDVIKGKV